MPNSMKCADFFMELYVYWHVLSYIKGIFSMCFYLNWLGLGCCFIRGTCPYFIESTFRGFTVCLSYPAAAG